MRYTVRWANGYWRVRDLIEYDDVGGLFDTQKLAQQSAAHLNREDVATAIATRVIARAKA